jgi:hypothetical protein
MRLLDAIRDALDCFLALGARPAPASEAEQSRDHEQAGAGFGDHHETETDDSGLCSVKRITYSVRFGEGRGAGKISTAHYAARGTCRARGRIGPLSDVPALVELPYGLAESV